MTSIPFGYITSLQSQFSSKAFRFPDASKAFCLLSRPDIIKAPCGVLLCLGDVVEDVRTVFERINDATIYIPEFQPQVTV